MTRQAQIEVEGINWHYEQTGSGPHVILVPDGLGECGLFHEAIPPIVAAGFTVTTFDMPGLSRSVPAPSETYTQVTARELAAHIISLLDALDILSPATFAGSSSGGATVLALAAFYPDRVRNVLPHEVPMHPVPAFSAVLKLSDEDLTSLLGETIMVHSCGNKEKWDALGPETHVRLNKNYARWARGYIESIPSTSTFTAKELKMRPVDWTVGADSPSGAWYDNFTAAARAGVGIGVLPGKHYPYVTDPEVWAEHIITKTKQYL